jgi:hypothetical protein
MYEQPSSKYGLVIRVDDAVRVAIEIARQPGESINDVLRRKLGLPHKDQLQCEACGSFDHVEEIPDVLNADTNICAVCFGNFEMRGWHTVTAADFPFWKGQD